MEKQDWEGKQLDKDLIGSGDKEYSFDSCVFISSKLNKLLIDSAAKRGIYPLGVCWDKTNSKFVSYIGINSKRKHLGYFLTREEAHKAWQQVKRDVIYKVALEQTDQRIMDALLLRCSHLQYDIDNDLETIKL